MTPSRPYLVRALHEWILDNDCIPYVMVDASMPGVAVPDDFVKEGRIVLNISPSAVHGLVIEDAGLSFTARFGGVPMSIYVPAMAIMGIYTKENGEGMFFGNEPGIPGPEDTPPPPGPKPAETKKPASDGSRKNSGRPSLRVVK